MRALDLAEISGYLNEISPRGEREPIVVTKEHTMAGLAYVEALLYLCLAILLLIRAISGAG
jgi:hypothetical protein